jgi:DNA primase
MQRRKRGKMPRYSEEIIEEVRQTNDIVNIISQYVHLKRSGRNYFGLCPFHNEKSPSFSVSPDKQIFHCFGCGVGGNVYTFLTKIEGISFIEAVQELAERSGIQLPTLDNGQDAAKEELKAKVYKVNEFAAKYYHENLYKPEAKPAQEYVKKRKLSNETLKAFQIGFSGKFDELYKELKKQGFQESEILESGLVNKNENGKYIDRYRNRLMFPICDIRGRVIAFGGRVLDDSKPKYINSNENIVYSKGRHLFGLNVAKKNSETKKKILIVEGYMDVISLHQRGVQNVVASLGTALTQQQGYLLRNNSEQIVLSFDSDEAGLNAKKRALEILQNMGCDIRVLQMEGAKDTDEFIIKYGKARFDYIVNKAISVLEFKVKLLRDELNLENTSDKIKFLNEIAKLIAKIDNNIEKEIYVEKIAKEYEISKEAIYAEVNKLSYSNTKMANLLEQKRPVERVINQEENISENIKRRENTIIAILLMGEQTFYEIIKLNVKAEDFKYEIDKKIAIKLYEEFEKGNSNINSIIDKLTEEEQNHITAIMAEDYEIDNNNIEKAIDDLIKNYKKEKLKERKMQILVELDQNNDDKIKKELETELSNIIISLAKIK